jgi:hypothetical protein
MSRGTPVRNRIKGLVVALVLTGAGLTAGLGSGVAAAQTGAPLPIASFDQIVADPANGYLFLSDPDQNEILVTSLTGQEVTTIGGQDGVMGIALSADGSTLYAALAAGDAVIAINTTTFAQTASYPLPAGDTPFNVAVQSGDVWVSYSTGTAGAIGDIDVSASAPAFATQPNMGGWASVPEIATDPQDTGVLVGAIPGSSPTSTASYNVSADPATLTSQTTLGNCATEEDLAVVPGGADFILACGSTSADGIYSTAGMIQVGSYVGALYPDAVAIDDNGDVAAGAQNGLTTTPDLYVFQQNDGTPANTFNLNASGANVAPRGLAWTPDGSQLFAVTSYYDDIGGTTNYSLQVLGDPTLTQPALTLTGPSRVAVTRPVTLTGSLSVAGSPLPAGTTITVSRSQAGSTVVKDFTTTTAADGSFSLTDTPPATGQYTYTAEYGGSTTVASATAWQTVSVTRISTSLKLTASPFEASYEATIQVAAHLGATYTSRTVSLYAQPFGASRRLLKTGKVNSHGDLTVSYRAAHSTEFEAVFSGDAHYTPKTVTELSYVKAKVTESLSGNSGSKRIGGQTYLVFHRKKTLDVHVTVAPDKAGECVEFTLAIYYQGAWHADTTSCGDLSKSSKLTLRVSLKKAGIGYHYRIRADYLPGSDTSNLGNDSAWAYFIVEK